jgi:hypothetical protein
VSLTGSRDTSSSHSSSGTLRDIRIKDWLEDEDAVPLLGVLVQPHDQSRVPDRSPSDLALSGAESSPTAGPNSQTTEIENGEEGEEDKE